MNLNPFVLFETDDFMVFYKPPFWKLDTPTKYNIKNEKEITNIMKKYVRPFHVYVGLYLKKYHNVDFSNSNNQSYGVVHRYDVQTSGGLIVSKTEKMVLPMRKIISDKKNTLKVYCALVNGILKNKNGYIQKNLDCSQKNNSLYCYTSTFGKHACSYYQVISEYKDDDGNTYSLLNVRIFTGRTHQIRVHLKHIGYPIVSDYKYLDKHTLKRNKKNIINRTFLHNFHLSIKYNNTPYTFTIPLSYDLIMCLEKLTRTIKYNNLLYLDDIILKTSCY